MVAPHQHKDYNALYHDFTEAYTSVYSLSRDFYPKAKRFVEHTEPELTRYVTKLSYQDSPKTVALGYEKLVLYMNHFDDFTLMANKLFSDLKSVLERSEQFINHMLDIKMNKAEKQEDATKAYYKITPELNELVNSLKQMPIRANRLLLQMEELENDWKKTKAKMI